MTPTKWHGAVGGGRRGEADERTLTCPSTRLTCSRRRKSDGGVRCLALVGAARLNSGKSRFPRETETATKAATARFGPGACPKTNRLVKELQRAQCGFLVVPEDRTKSNSRTIRLPVVIIRAAASRADDPIVYLLLSARDQVWAEPKAHASAAPTGVGVRHGGNRPVKL